MNKTPPASPACARLVQGQGGCARGQTEERPFPYAQYQAVGGQEQPTSSPSGSRTRNCPATHPEGGQVATGGPPAAVPQQPDVVAAWSLKAPVEAQMAAEANIQCHFQNCTTPPRSPGTTG